MLTNFLYKYTSTDKLCLLGLIPNKKDFAKLISPLNEKHIWPKKISNMPYDSWIKNHSIISDSVGNLLSYNDEAKRGEFYSTNQPWHLKTKLSLIEAENNSLTVSTKLKIDTQNIGNSKIQLLKQGGDDLSTGLIDIYFEFKRASATDGSLDKLCINAYYLNANPITYELTNIDTLVNKDVQLTIVINPSDMNGDLVKVYSNNDLIGRKRLEITNIDEIALNELEFNNPPNSSLYDHVFIGGSGTSTQKMRMMNMFIWNRPVSIDEIKLFNKLV